MKKMLLAVALVAALLPLSAAAQNSKFSPNAISPKNIGPAATPCAGCLFYGGDWDTAASNWVAFGNGNEYDAGTVYNYSNYVPFVVPSGQTWTVTGLFTNNIFYNYFGGSSYKFQQNDTAWGISTGVSTGNGGTDFASGTGHGTAATTGRNYGGFYPEYTVTWKTLSPLTLAAGSYWLTVAPSCTASSCELFFYNTDTTSLTNHVGHEPKCQSYQNGPTAGLNYVNDCTQGYAVSGEAYMSAGVLGHK